MQKGDKLENFKSKQPETRAFKGTCYVTKKVLYWWGKPYKKISFEWLVTLKEPYKEPTTLYVFKLSCWSIGHFWVEKKQKSDQSVYWYARSFDVLF